MHVFKSKLIRLKEHKDKRQRNEKKQKMETKMIEIKTMKSETTMNAK